MLSSIGIPGLILITIVCLFLFGSKNLPEIGKSAGKSLREFKEAFNSDPTNNKHQISGSENSKETNKKRESM